MNQESRLLEDRRGEAVGVAIRTLSGELVRFRQGAITNDEFRPNRTILGVYGQRQPEEYMVRIRLPYGMITAPQLRAIGKVAETYGNGIAHVTTRQDVQLPWLVLDAMPEILERLRSVGLITLQSGGNSVRNVAACPLAGVCGNEVFDVTGHASSVDEYYVGNPAVQNLPRKFKSSFSGCPTDCGLSAIQDFGAIAVTSTDGGRPENGFQVYVGGGLGSMPRPAVLLEDFVTEKEMLLTYEAVLRVFDRFGDRTRKDRARLKFVVARLGVEEFRRLVRQEREALKSEGLSFPSIGKDEPFLPSAEMAGPLVESWDPGYYRWYGWNVAAQRQQGYYSVAIALPLGDITKEQMETVAALTERLEGSTLRTSVQQNLYLRGVAGSALPSVYTALSEAGLTALRASGIADVTSCPGTTACSLGIASSKGLGKELQQMLLSGGYQQDEALGQLRVKVSGCPDACGQHYLGDIGFSGAALHKDGHLYPAYILHLGGKVDEGGTRLGQPILKLPARKVPQALERLLSFYKEGRRANESFAPFVSRVGAKAIRDLLNEFTLVPTVDQDPWNYIDWDATRMYILERGEGECAV